MTGSRRRSLVGRATPKTIDSRKIAINSLVTCREVLLELLDSDCIVVVLGCDIGDSRSNDIVDEENENTSAGQGKSPG